MKPSQVSNLLSHTPPRRVLPLQTPEQGNKDGFSPQWHHPHPAGPVNSPEFVLNSPNNIDSPVNHLPKGNLAPKHLAQPPGSFPSSPANACTTAYTPLSTPRERSGPQQGTVPAKPGHFCSSLPLQASPCDNIISFDRPSFSSVSVSPSTESVKNFSNHSTPSHSRSNQETELKVTHSISGNKNDKVESFFLFYFFSLFTYGLVIGETSFCPC